MKKLSNYCLAGAFAVICFSCNSGSSDSAAAAKDSNAVKMDSARSDSTGRAAIPSTVSKADQDFAVNAADAGMTEIQAGQITPHVPDAGGAV